MKNSKQESSVVADGHQRVRKGIEAEARPEIEQKYSEEWNTSGYLRRWFLQRKINREVAQQVAQRQAQQAPPDALY